MYFVSFIFKILYKQTETMYLGEMKNEKVCLYMSKYISYIFLFIDFKNNEEREREQHDIREHNERVINEQSYTNDIGE